jgi:hypothetical protein
MALAGLACVWGCDTGGGRVAGMVRFRGNPVARGDVSFYDGTTGRGGMAAITSGSFSFSHPLDPGKYAVAVTPPSPVRPEDPVPQCPDVPRKYHEATKSGLTFTVTKGQNEYVIDLE